jgi:hypothetical protein
MSPSTVINRVRVVDAVRRAYFHCDRGSAPCIEQGDAAAVAHDCFDARNSDFKRLARVL